MRKALEAELNAHLRDAVVCVEKTDARTIFIDVKRDSIRQAAKLVTEAGGRYMCSVGYDNIARDGTLGMVHTFSFDKRDHFVCCRTKAPAFDPVMESITPDLPIRRMVRARIHGPARAAVHRSPEAQAAGPGRRLAGGHPPAAQGGPAQPRAAGGRGRRLPARRGAARDDRIVPVGPFHPSLHEPEHFAVYVDGETIKGCDYRGFMTHRGHREALPDPGQLQRGPVHRRADLRHLRLGARRLRTRRPSRSAARHQDLPAGRVHPDAHARDRAPPQPPPLARRRRPPHRLRHGLHAGLARPRADHVAVRAASPATARPTA